MKTICLYFQVHQPFRLKKYRFFDMGFDHNYLDDAANRAAIQRLAHKCYLPMNALLLKLIDESQGKFKVTFSISGVAIEQFRLYMPEVLDSFRQLAETGCVEMLAETYSHSLASLADPTEFEKQVIKHCQAIEKEFGYKPTAFRNTELIYSDSIGEQVARMGFNTMLAEGAKHVMGWRSPNYLYANALNPKLKLMLRNFRLSDDIAIRFSNRSWSEWPLTVEKYTDWLSNESQPGEIINLFMDYETFGENNSVDSGIFDFMKLLPAAVIDSGELRFATVSQAAKDQKPIGVLSSRYAMSWRDEERDTTAWLGNEMQKEAFGKLYSLSESVAELEDKDMEIVWSFMQTSDHFQNMATKWISDGNLPARHNPYGSSYDAFINYMNILSDFEIELMKRHKTHHTILE